MHPDRQEVVWAAGSGSAFRQAGSMGSRELQCTGWQAGSMCSREWQCIQAGRYYGKGVALHPGRQVLWAAGSGSAPGGRQVVWEAGSGSASRQAGSMGSREWQCTQASR